MATLKERSSSPAAWLLLNAFKLLSVGHGLVLQAAGSGVPIGRQGLSWGSFAGKDKVEGFLDSRIAPKDEMSTATGGYWQAGLGRFLRSLPTVL